MSEHANKITVTIRQTVTGDSINWKHHADDAEIVTSGIGYASVLEEHTRAVEGFLVLQEALYGAAASDIA